MRLVFNYSRVFAHSIWAVGRGCCRADVSLAVCLAAENSLYALTRFAYYVAPFSASRKRAVSAVGSRKGTKTAQTPAHTDVEIDTHPPPSRALEARRVVL